MGIDSGLRALFVFRFEQQVDPRGLFASAELGSTTWITILPPYGKDSDLAAVVGTSDVIRRS
jgi:hypothetical protein